VYCTYLPPLLPYLKRLFLQTWNSPPATAEAVSFKYIHLSVSAFARVIHVALTPKITSQLLFYS
jgi:hypothetical protein